MPNLNLKRAYKTGRSKEYAIIRKLKEKELGFDICQRTANSRSPFDIIAIRFKDMKILLVQSKSIIPQSERNKIMLDNAALNGKFNVEYQVWC